jgi:hypothetical protein
MAKKKFDNQAQAMRKAMKRLVELQKQGHTHLSIRICPPFRSSFSPNNSLAGSIDLLSTREFDFK